MLTNLVVAGATGYLGSHLVQEAARRGVKVRALVRGGKRVAGASEHFDAEVTRPETLRGLCEGADAVFSALGITRQTDRVGFEDIDLRANLAVLAEAQRSGVRRFGVISVIEPRRFEGVELLVHRERFIRELQAREGVSACVMRATGFFSDLTEPFHMAQRGRVYLLGDGTTRINPIHGADLAAACLDALANGNPGRAVGGPDTFTWNEVARLAFEVLGRREKVTHVPAGLVRAALPLVGLFSRRARDVGDFLLHGAVADLVAPSFGTHALATYYRALAPHEPTNSRTPGMDAR